VLASSDDTPDALTLTAGGREALTVLIDRSDSFTSDVELTVEGLPGGVTCPPHILNNAVRGTPVVLSANDGTAPWAGKLRIKGTATANGTKVVREARPAGIVWPMQPNQNAPTISRLERELWMAVRGKAPFTLTPSIDKPQILQGDK